MAFAEVTDLETTETVTIGGFNKKTNKPNPTKIEGYYLGTRGGIPNKFNPDKPNQLHVLQTPKGNVGVWGKSNLDKKMGSATPGCMIRITFTGTQDVNKGNPMLCYKLEVDRDNTIDVSGLSAASTQEEPASGYEEVSETALDAEEEPSYEAPVAAPPAARAQAPRTPAAKPNAASAARVQQLLSGRKN